MGNMKNLFRLPKLILLVFGLFSILLLWSIFRPGWSVYRGGGFLVKYPSSWFTLSLVDSETKDRQQEYLVSINNARQMIDPTGYKTDRPEYGRVVISRYSKEKLNMGITELADKNLAAVTAQEDRVYSRLNTQFLGQPTFVDTIYSTQKDDFFKKQYFYWIDNDRYVYSISAAVFVDSPFWMRFYYDFIIRNMADSLILK